MLFVVTLLDVVEIFFLCGCDWVLLLSGIVVTVVEETSFVGVVITALVVVDKSVSGMRG